MHYGVLVSQITSLMIVYSTVYSGADQRKHQSFASLAFVRGIHRWPVNSPHKGPVKRKMFPFDDVIMGWVLYPIITCGRDHSSMSQIKWWMLVWVSSVLITQGVKYSFNRLVNLVYSCIKAFFLNRCFLSPYTWPSKPNKIHLWSEKMVFNPPYITMTSQ